MLYLVILVYCLWKVLSYTPASPQTSNDIFTIERSERSAVLSSLVMVMIVDLWIDFETTKFPNTDTVFYIDKITNIGWISGLIYILSDNQQSLKLWKTLVVSAMVCSAVDIYFRRHVTFWYWRSESRLK